MSRARTRILAAALLLLALSTIVSLVTLRQILLARAVERADRSLTQEAAEFQRLLTNGRDPRDNSPLRGNLRRAFDIYLGTDVADPGEGAYTFLHGRPYRTNAHSDDDGGIGGDKSLASSVRPLGGLRKASRGKLDAPGRDARYLAVPIEIGGARGGAFVAVADLGADIAEVHQVVKTAAIVSGAVFLLAALAALLAAGRVLAPLRELTETARAITDSDLTGRIDVRGDDEIAELARTFNAMLDRLESAFESQRSFLADAGHELRTPITIVRGHLELLGSDPVERRETLELVADELERMGRLVDDLLTLAKAERGDFLALETVDLDALTLDLRAKAVALAERDWRLGDVGVGQVVADPQRLTQAVMNLARNAAEHTQPGGLIELGSELRANRARLWVSDSGEGIADEDRERIFERFARGADAARRGDGSGLGLAIVRAVAVAHGGRVTLDGSASEGATFTIEIPVAPMPQRSTIASVP